MTSLRCRYAQRRTTAVSACTGVSHHFVTVWASCAVTVRAGAPYHLFTVLPSCAVTVRTGVGDLILAGFKSGEAYTIFAPPDDILGADFEYPDYCKSGRNYDVDQATAQSTGGLHVVSGLFPKADVIDLGVGTQVSALLVYWWYAVGSLACSSLCRG